MERNTDRKAEILAGMIDSKGSRRAFAEKIGMPPTTLQSMLTKDLGRASINNVLDVCRELGITVEQLYDMAEGEQNESETISTHHDDEDWTSEEIEEIEQFKRFVKMKKKQKE